MTVLESLLFSEYIKFLKYKKVEDIKNYKQEYIEYTENNNLNISSILKEFLKLRYGEKSDNVEIDDIKKYIKMIKAN